MKKNRIIQGLRALAVLSVIFYHTGFTWIPGGFLGVDVFFVISGYLISGIIIREIKATNRFDFKGFYAKRVRRLVPAASIVMIFTLIVGHHLISPLRIKNLGLDSLSATFYGANFRFYYSQIDYLNLGQQPSLFLHFWSLAVEEQFYILWPLLLLLAWRISRKYGLQVFLLFAFFISFLYSLNVSYSNPTLAFYSIFTRSWEFAVGMLSYLLFSKIRISSDALRSVLGVFGLTGLVASLLLVKSSDAIPGWIVLFPVFSTALILGISTQGNFLGFRFFENRLSNWVGSISYSLYLWHWPIYLLLAEVLGKKPFGIYILEFFVLTTLSSAIVYYVLELPIRNYQRIARKHGLAFFWGGIFSTISALIAFNLLGIRVFPAAQKSAASSAGQVNTIPSQNSPVPSPTPILALGATQGGTVAPIPDLHQTGSEGNSLKVQDNFPLTLPMALEAQSPVSICMSDLPISVPAPCSYGDLNATKTIVLWGDSHASQWGHALRISGKKYHFKVIEFTKAGCPAPAFIYATKGSGKYYPECLTYRDSALKSILLLHPNLIVISAVRRYGSNFSAVDSAYTAIMKPIQNSGVKALLISDTPYPSSNIPECLAKHLLKSSICDTPIQSANTPDIFSMLQVIAKKWGVSVFDPMPWFCNSITCPAVIDHIVAYKDNSHISKLISEAFAEKIYAAISGSL